MIDFQTILAWQLILMCQEFHLVLSASNCQGVTKIFYRNIFDVAAVERQLRKNLSKYQPV